MVKNTVYNLLLQIVEEHKALWRIKDEYMKDAKQTPDVKKMWLKIAKEKETHVNELLKLLKKHLK